MQQRWPAQLKHAVAQANRRTQRPDGGQFPHGYTVDGDYRRAGRISGVHPEGVHAGGCQLDLQPGGRGGMQSDPAQRKRQPRCDHPGISSGAIKRGGQGMQRRVKQGRVDTVAGDISVSGQLDLGIHHIGPGRVVTDTAQRAKRGGVVVTVFG